jgi:hypothetical protein
MNQFFIYVLFKKQDRENSDVNDMSVLLSLALGIDLLVPSTALTIISWIMFTRLNEIEN